MSEANAVPGAVTNTVEFKSAVPNMLVVSVPRATTFYTTRLGFALASDGPGFAVLKRGHVTIGLIESKNAVGKGWCYVTVSDPTMLFAQFRAAGVKILQPLETWPDHTEFSITDPDGNRLDIGN